MESKIITTTIGNFVMTNSFKVLTEDGWKKIKDLEVGNRMVAYDEDDNRKGTRINMIA